MTRRFRTALTSTLLAVGLVATGATGAAAADAPAADTTTAASTSTTESTSTGESTPTGEQQTGEQQTGAEQTGAEQTEQPAATDTATTTTTPTHPECVDRSGVTYTWDGRTGSVTAPDLCEPLYVAVATWSYDGAALWPQTAIQYDIIEVDNGTVPLHNVMQACTQRDLYASYDRSELAELGVGSALTAAGQPYEPEFLHTYAYGTLNPSWQADATEGCGELPTHPIAEADVVVTPPTCDADGSYQLVSETGGAVFTVDGTVAEAGDPVTVAGDRTIEVSVAPAEGYGFAEGQQTEWELVFDRTALDCEPTHPPVPPTEEHPPVTPPTQHQPPVTPAQQLPTLALDAAPTGELAMTGTDGDQAAQLATASLLLLGLGAALVVRSRRRARA